MDAKHSKRMAIRMSKKAFYFTMDAMFSSFLLIGGLLLISQYLVKEPTTESISFASADMLSALSELKVDELNSTFVSTYLLPNNNTNLNISVLEQIGTYWATNNTDLAINLTEHVLKGFFPNNTGFSLVIGDDDDVLFEKSIGNAPINLLVGERMITGIAEGAPLTGSTSSAYLQRIQDKRTSSFAYFGGFVGQGNITIRLDGIPGDVEPEDISRVLMELDAVSSFRVLINNDYCTIINPSNTTMTPESWDISSCNGSLQPGRNNITLDFQGNINEAYVMGGYVRVDYKTDELQQSISTTNKTYFFPEIKGIVNLYDGFYIPGNLTEMTIYLHYLADHSVYQNNTFYLTVGNTVVLLDNYSLGEQAVTLSDINLSAVLDYELLSGKTIPIRMGFENITFETILVEGGEGFGDIIVTTDVSGSMDWEFNSSEDGDEIIDCSDPSLYDPSTSRISVARCVDKIFVDEVLLNTTLNRIGLVSYSGDTDSTLPLTNDEELLKDEINSYDADGATCIACGITDAYNLLSSPGSPQLHKDVWKYDVNHQFIDPDTDWNSLLYDDSSWLEGNVPFGYRVTGVATVLNINNVSANLWEYNSGSYSDDPGPPNDFDSGRLNSTRNTYGLNASGDDGWDNKTGVYGGGSSGVTIAGLYNVGGGWGGDDYELRIDIAGSSSTQTSDGSYGIQFNVTSAMMDIITGGGYAVVSFDYSWVEGWGNDFQSSDQVWVKARITNTTNQSIYLGSQLDSGHQGNDSTYEVACADNPSNDFSGPFSQDISSIITTTGYYYLDFGGKVLRNRNSEDGRFYFDNVQVSFVSNVQNTYYRNIFSMHNLTRFSNARLYVASDDNAEVYLNGNLLDDDTAVHSRSYWNRNISVSIGDFEEGENILAVKLRNNDSTSGFLDVELKAEMVGRQSAILIMSDGDANRCVRAWDGDGSSSYCDDCSGRACCPDYASGEFNVTCPDIPELGGSSDGDERAFEQVVNISCYLHNKYNISIYTVAFGTGATVNGTKTLNLSASCDDPSHFYTTTNVSEIAGIYHDIASSIVQGFSTKESQIVVFTGSNLSASNIYDDSYIYYEYTPIISDPVPNEISIEIQTDQFNSCSPTVTIPSGIRVADAKITSYSGEHWTRTFVLNSNTVYNLTEYDANYITLGDPYLIQAPPTLFVNGSNSIYVDTGDDSMNSTGCSPNNTLIYTALVPSSTARSEVVEHTIGCNWTIQFEDDTYSTKNIPLDYSGTKRCSYTETNHSLANGSYDPTDAYDIAVFNLLKELDFDNNGKVFVNLDASDIEIVITTVSSVPYLWGPTLVKARVWQ